MKNLIQAAVVILFGAQAAQGQQAVQWPVSDGGNGHWYQRNSQPLSWAAARQFALAEGGDLATLTTQTESAFAFAVDGGIGNCWIGGFQSADACEPACQWTWVTGEPWVFSAWRSGQPDNTSGTEDSLCFWGGEQSWNDGTGSDAAPSIMEWSADCNGDGVVDYGQCRDGTLSDYNGNNTPDCCERGEACVVGSYPLQWRTSEGGNGHWYRRVARNGRDWFGCRQAARSIGGDLASITSMQEQIAIETLVPMRVPGGSSEVVFFGGSQSVSRPPKAGWAWSDGSPWDFTNWEPGQPDGGEGFLALYRYANATGAIEWGDWSSSDPQIEYFALEWSADCNNDGIVDYGQIIQGQLSDANTNGTPDICEGPTCHDIDLNLNGIVDGGDLGVLLAFWGTVSPAFPRADINGDGLVNGADLGTLLSFWGPCPN
jgi:hypothetical protein